MILCSMYSLYGNNVEYFSHFFHCSIATVMRIIEGSFSGITIFFFVG